MNNLRTDEDVRNYDIFKGIITVLLLVTLFIVAALGYGGVEETAYPGSPAEEVAGAEESMEGETAEPAPSSEISAPELLSPAPGSALEAGPQTFSGMGMIGSQVALVTGDTEIGRTLVDNNGTWELSADIPPGIDAILLQSLDSSGNVLATSDPIPMTSAAPAVRNEAAETAESPAATSPSPPTVNFPSGDLTADQPLTFSGTGQPGTQLQLLANGTEIGTTTVAADSTWTLETTLPEGDYAIDLAVLDASGNTQSVLPALSIPIAGPAAPSFVLPQLSLPDFNPLTGALAWEGESAPGSRVAAIVDDEIVDQATADSQGRWRLLLPLAAGVHSLAFGQLDQNDNVTSSSEPVTIEVPGQMPQFTLPDGSLNAASDESGNPELSLPEGTTELSGTADPGQEVALIVNGEVSATAVADADGNFTLPVELTEATRTVQLGVIGPDGTLLSKSLEITVSTGEAVAEAPTEGSTAEPGAEATAEPGAQATAAPSTGEAVPEGSASVSGTVTYPEDSNLPDGALITVQIINLSQADAVATVLAEQTIATDGSQGPVPFEVPYDPAEVDENMLYGAIARIESGDGTLLFISDMAKLVITGGSPTSEVEVATVQVRSDAADAALGTVDTDLSESATTVLEAMQNSGQFTTLLDGLEAAGLMDRLAEIGTAYTIFAPTDAAFAGVPAGVLAGWTYNPDEFATILRNTVVEGLYGPDSLTNGLVLQSLANSNIGVQNDGQAITINGVPVIDLAPAGESYVYALPQVILPPLPAGVTAPTIDVAGVPIFIGDRLTVVGVGQPGTRIILTIDEERFGDVAVVNEERFWQIEGDIGPGIHSLVAYMIDNNGLLMATSQEVTLSVPES